MFRNNHDCMQELAVKLGASVGIAIQGQNGEPVVKQLNAFNGDLIIQTMVDTNGWSKKWRILAAPYVLGLRNTEWTMSCGKLYYDIRDFLREHSYCMHKRDTYAMGELKKMFLAFGIKHIYRRENECGNILMSFNEEDGSELVSLEDMV